jgi:hypothetical protein
VIWRSRRRKGRKASRHSTPRLCSANAFIAGSRRHSPISKRRHGVGGPGRRVWIRRLVAGLFSELLIVSASPAAEKYRSDDWVTVCEPAPGSHSSGCSLTVPVEGVQHGIRGAFALVVVLDSGMIGIVGEPYPVRAVLRIDNDPPIECREWRYCLFPPDQSLDAIKELAAASLILIDVQTARATFRFSLTPRGYQAGIAQIRAWGYRVPWD